MHLRVERAVQRRQQLHAKSLQLAEELRGAPQDDESIGCMLAQVLRNLLAVIAGNLVGGSVLVALVYWVVYLRPAGKSPG